MFFLSILKSIIFRYLVLALAVIAVVAAIYLKGRSDAKNAIIRQQAKEVVERVNAERKVIDGARKVRRQVETVRDNSSQVAKDTVYSCILSSDPMVVDCTTITDL